MGLRIQTNTQSLAAQRNLGINNGAQRTSMEKMAAGSRIVRAADDAAGLAISERMQGQIKSLGQGIRNANDGISMIQTAEGSMNEVGNMLIRFRELSMQAASDTVGTVERKFIDKEIQQLKTEIDRIAQSTEYNGTKLLNGQAGKLEVQVGTNNNAKFDRFVFDAGQTKMTTDALGIASLNTMTKEAAQQNLAKVDVALNRLNENRATMGALQNRLSSSVSNAQVYHENLSAARSRIRDLDVASESSELAKQNILTSASVSVLSQANVNPQAALKLIG